MNGKQLKDDDDDTNVSIQDTSNCNEWYESIGLNGWKIIKNKENNGYIQMKNILYVKMFHQKHQNHLEFGTK